MFSRAIFGEQICEFPSKWIFQNLMLAACDWHQVWSFLSVVISCHVWLSVFSGSERPIRHCGWSPLQPGSEALWFSSCHSQPCQSKLKTDKRGAACVCGCLCWCVCMCVWVLVLMWVYMCVHCRSCLFSFLWFELLVVIVIVVMRFGCLDQHGCSLHLNFVQPAELRFFAWGTWIRNCWFSVSSDFSLFFILHARHDCDIMKHEIKFKSPKILPKHIMLGGLAFITLKIVLLQTVVWRILYLVCFPPIVWRVVWFQPIIWRLSCLHVFYCPSQTRERRRHESILTEEFVESICYLNQFLPPAHAIKYIHFDMARVTKRYICFH